MIEKRQFNSEEVINSDNSQVVELVAALENTLRFRTEVLSLKDLVTTKKQKEEKGLDDERMNMLFKEVLQLLDPKLQKINYLDAELDKVFDNALDSVSSRKVVFAFRIDRKGGTQKDEDHLVIYPTLYGSDIVTKFMCEKFFESVLGIKMYLRNSRDFEDEFLIKDKYLPEKISSLNHPMLKSDQLNWSCQYDEIVIKDNDGHRTDSETVGYYFYIFTEKKQES